MKWSLVLASAAMAVTLLDGPALASENGVESKAGIIVVATELDYPPYSFLDDDGSLMGFNVDLTEAIAKVAGLKIEIRIDAWGKIRDALESHEIDAISGMYYSKERDHLVDFSPPYTVVHHAIFAHRDSPVIRSEEELRGKKIIVMRGDIMHDYVLKRGLCDSPALAGTQAEALQLLASGEHDYALVAKLPGLYWVGKLKLSNLAVVGPLLRPSRYCYAVEEGNIELLTRFAEGLAIVKQTGLYAELHDKWLGALESRGIATRSLLKYIGMALLPLLIVLAGSLLWSRSLKRQVARKTWALEAEIAERKRMEEALRQAMAESRESVARLGQFNHLAVGREHQMIELKRQINELAAELGRPAPHDLSFLQTVGGPSGHDGA